MTAPLPYDSVQRPGSDGSAHLLYMLDPKTSQGSFCILLSVTLMLATALSITVASAPC